MKHSLGNGLIQQAICQPSVVDASIRTHPGPSSSLVPRVSSGSSRVNHAVNRTKNPLLRTKFVDIPLTAAKTSSWSSLNRAHKAAFMVPRAVIAADPPSELGGKFVLEGNTELEVAVTAPSSGSLVQVDLQVTDSSASLILHWGVLRRRTKDWNLPSRRPNGTTVYKNKALRTPFQKSGPNSSLRIEIDDPEAQAIEFLIFDEAQNKWEALFYGGVAIFLLLIDRVWRPLHQVQAEPKTYVWSKLKLGFRISSVATFVLSLIIPLVTMGMVWPWTGPAASATLAPYLVGLVVQFAFEQYARFRRSPAWSVIPVIFQVYRLHQLNRAAQLVTALSFSVRGAEMTPQILAINSSLGTLLSVLQILGVICIWSLSSFLMRFLPASRVIPDS